MIRNWQTVISIAIVAVVIMFTVAAQVVVARSKALQAMAALQYAQCQEVQ